MCAGLIKSTDECNDFLKAEKKTKQSGMLDIEQDYYLAFSDSQRSSHLSSRAQCANRRIKEGIDVIGCL